MNNLLKYCVRKIIPLLILITNQSHATSPEEITKWVKSYNYDELLVLSLIHVESRFNLLSFNPEGSGSYGLMQIQCTTAKDRRLANPLKHSCDQLFNPKINIRLGIEYLRLLESLFKPSDRITPNIVSAYNAGLERGDCKVENQKPCKAYWYIPRRCSKYRTINIPGIPQTECYPGEYFNQEYVTKVHRRYKYLKNKK